MNVYVVPAHWAVVDKDPLNHECVVVFGVCRVEESYEVLQLKHVEIGTGESVYVTHAADLTDFRVCTLCIVVGLYYGIVWWCNIWFRNGIIDKMRILGWDMTKPRKIRICRMQIS